MKENKHDHKGTKALKTALFSVVMLLPIISIGATILTHTFNEKVATPSKDVTINYMYETNEVNTMEDIVRGNAYRVNTKDYNFFELIKVEDSAIFFTPLSNMKINEMRAFSDAYLDGWADDLNISTKPYENFAIYINYTYTNDFTYQFTFEYGDYLDIYFEFYETDVFITTDNDYIDIVILDYIDLLEINNNILKPIPQNELPIESIEITETTDTITNIFENSANSVFESNIFNWTNNAMLKQPITAFTNVFGIDQANIINNLLTYWLTATGIYIVIDIIIEMFIKLTHLFNKNA